MKAWVVNEWCDPAGMELAEIPIPEPGERQVLIRVEAAALNFLDTLMIRGEYQVKPPLPFTPGVEVGGTVEAAGPGSEFAVGDRVCALIDWGGYAEYAVATDLATTRIPDELGVVDGVAMPVVYPTAYVSLRHQARVQSGETVLVHAGAGGVGLAAIQIARAWGCRVIATAGGAEKLAICSEHGADLTIDYRDADWLTEVKGFTGGEGVDVVLDPVGGEVTEQSVRALAWGGRLIIIGFAGGRIASIPANRLLLKNAAAIGVFWGDYRKNEAPLVRSTYEDLFGMLHDGLIKPVVSERYPFADAPEALSALAQRRTHGKVALVP